MDDTPNPVQDHPIYRGAAKTARVQIVISIILGLSAFVTFSMFKLKYPKIYIANFNHYNQGHLHSSSRQTVPKLPSHSLFGWIPVVFQITEDQVLEHAGLDAVVFLGFFKMCIKILATCVVLALGILSPIRYYLTGQVDQDYPSDQDQKFRRHNNEYLLWLYVLFTYVFTFIVLNFLFKLTNHIINMRQRYLSNQNSITDRTIKLSGIPPYLRDELDLKRHIQSLGLGEIEKIVIVREWGDLNKLFELRRRYLHIVENYWVKYFEMNNINNKVNWSLNINVGDLFNMSGSSLSDESINNLPILMDETHKRPKISKTWYNPFSTKIDAILYYTEQLEIIDKEIIRARTREYPATSSAFITMNSVIEAQLISQAVLDPKVNHLTTTLAPAPHDIRWDNLCMTRKERNTRIGAVTLLIGIISLWLVVPVGYLARFLNTKTISQISPKLGEFLKNNQWAESLVTGVLPPYIFTILNIVMPYFYIWITEKQGYTSHSDEELSSVSKNFFYMFVNLFLVFTLVGTASLTDTIKIAYQLAQSLRDLSIFYVDLIILQGIGIFPYKLLLLGNLFNFSFGSLLWCKTPRDYIRLVKPPIFDFGLQLPQPILVFIIVIIYSVVSSKILTAGLIYFLIGYFVFKYQLIYACVHPPHSTGKVWPLIFHRVVLGISILHIMMAATLSLQKAYYSVITMVPLPFIVFTCLWNFEKNYIPLSYFIALKSINTGDTGQYHDEESLVNNPLQTLDERREVGQTYDYPYLIKSLDGPIVGVERNEMLLIDPDGNIIRKPCSISI